jgi:hypothetical protein
MSRKCPQCGSLAVRRSSFEGPDEQQDHVLLSPYRCENCGSRFWVISRRARYMSIGILVLLILMIAWMIIPWPPPAEVTERRASAALYESAMLLPDGVGQRGRTVARGACCEIWSNLRRPVQGAGYWLS